MKNINLNFKNLNLIKNDINKSNIKKLLSIKNNIYIEKWKILIELRIILIEIRKI
jgi:hypothetical protein